MSDQDGYWDWYSSTMRKAFKCPSSRLFWFSDFMNGDYRSNKRLVDWDRHHMVYVYATLRPYGLGTTCFIVPAWVVYG